MFVPVVGLLEGLASTCEAPRCLHMASQATNIFMNHTVWV